MNLDKVIDLVRRRDTNTLTQVLSKEKINLNVTNRSRETPLSIAIKLGYTDIVRLFLAKGADPNLKDSKGVTPLGLALLTNNLDAVKILLNSGADPNERVGQISFPLNIAINRGQVEAVRDLLEAGARPNEITGQSPLFDAIYKNNFEIIKLLLDYGADPNLKDKKGNTPIDIAIENESNEIIKLLLDHGANKDMKNLEGVTPLGKAIINDDVEAARLLLQSGANPNEMMNMAPNLIDLAKLRNDLDIIDEIREMPELIGSAVYSAVVRDNYEMVLLLLTFGANPNLGTENGSTPLGAAISKGLIKIVKLLLENGADPNIEDTQFGLPLNIALDIKSIELVKLLLEKGAAPLKEVLNKSLSKASFLGNAEAVRILLEYGANPNGTEDNSTGFLSIPLLNVSEGDNDIVVDLLNAGADPNIINSLGQTPLTSAIRNKDPERVQLLLNAGADPQGIHREGQFTFEPLMMSVYEGTVEITKILLEAGAKITQKIIDLAKLKGNHRTMALLDYYLFIEPIRSGNQESIQENSRSKEYFQSFINKWDKYCSTPSVSLNKEYLREMANLLDIQLVSGDRGASNICTIIRKALETNI